MKDSRGGENINQQDSINPRERTRTVLIKGANLCQEYREDDLLPNRQTISWARQILLHNRHYLINFVDYL